MRRRYALPFIALALPACSGPTINAHRAGDLYPTSTAAQPTTSAPEVDSLGATTTSGAGPTSTSTIPSTTTTVTTVMQVEPEPVVRPQRAADGPGLGSDLLACIRSYEQGEAGYRTDTGNGFYGAYQFDLPTWRSVGGSGNPAHASPAEQDARALALYESRGLAPWPTPSRLCA